MPTFNREEATRIVRSAAGLDQPDLGEVLQGGEGGMVFSPPNRHRVREISGSVEISLRDSILLCNTGGGDLSLGLPRAAKAVWKVYTFKKISEENDLHIVPRGSELIDGSSPLTIETQNQTVKIVSDGESWWVI